MFDNLHRDDKINRIFLTLSLFVQLFEADLAMWTLRNNRDPSAKIFNDSKGPLIGTVLWIDGEPNQVNYIIKNIIKIYVSYININFPHEHTQVIGRLVNLIYNVFDLSEFTKSQNHEAIVYPHSEETQSYFCDAFTRAVFDTIGCSVDSWLRIIKLIVHPKFKLLLINSLLTKINHKNVALNPENIYETLQKLELSLDESSTHDNNNIEPTNVKLNTMVDAKYPYLQKVYKRTSVDVTFENDVELHLSALNAYISAYHIAEFREINQGENIQKMNENIRSFQAERAAYEKATPEIFDLQRMVKSQQKLFNDRVKLLEQNRQIYTLEVLNNTSGIILEVRSGVRKYRNDFKHIDLVATKLPKLRRKFGSLFPEPISKF